MPYGAWVAQADIGPQGRPYALIEQSNGFRELLSLPDFANQWWPMPFPAQGKLPVFIAGNQGLAVVSMEYAQPNSPDVVRSAVYRVTWFDDNGSQPLITTHVFEGLSEISPKAFALSSDGDVLVAGSPQYTTAQPVAAQPDQLLLARRDRELLPIAELPLSQNEVDIGKTYLIGGSNNTAVVARTISKNIGPGNLQIGVRVNQYDLPSSL